MIRRDNLYLNSLHTTYLQTEKEGIISATGLYRQARLGELIHTQDGATPASAQLWRKRHSIFNIKKIQIICSVCAMTHVGKLRGLCFSLTASLSRKVRNNLIFSLHIFLDSELFTYMRLEPETLTEA